MESRLQLFGLPLIHMTGGRLENGRYRRGIARGWIAVGDIAFGVILAVGGFAVGGIGIGGADSASWLWGVSRSAGLSWVALPSASSRRAALLWAGGRRLAGWR